MAQCLIYKVCKVVEGGYSPPIVRPTGLLVNQFISNHGKLRLDGNSKIGAQGNLKLDFYLQKGLSSFKRAQ